MYTDAYIIYMLTSICQASPSSAPGASRISSLVFNHVQS